MARALRRWHPDLYAASGREAFQDEVDGLAARMEALDEPQRVLGLMRILAHVGDSHTRLESTGAIEDLRYPFTVAVHQDEFWIEAVQEGRADLDTTRIVAVEDRPMADVVYRLARLVPADNEVALRAGVARLLGLPRALRDVGLARDLTGTRLRLRDRFGVEFDARVEALDAGLLGPWTTYAERPTPPLAPRPGEPWWWEALPDAGALYLRYDHCRDRDQPPRFADLARALLARLDAGGFERVVVDLRRNGGGDSRVLRPLVEGLAARRAQVIALIGPGTYSSAMLNAWQLQGEAGATLVGEPTGGRPNHFGEIRVVTLPNSGLEVSCSTKRFRLVQRDPSSLEPDLLVPQTVADLLAGRDPALAAALTLERREGP